MMFEASDAPRVFGVPPGADFPDVLFRQITSRYADQPPEALALVQILVPTMRMQRRLKHLFRNGQARLLPRISVVTDVTKLMPGADLPVPVSTLRRSLELKELVARLVELNPSLAPGSVVDLTDSLARLLDEMQSEGVPLSAFETMNAEAGSGHWEQSLNFLRAVRGYVDALTDGTADVESRHRAAVEMLCETWRERPPTHPILLAGSTGSRATTRLLMEAVARLPQGALVLPGFDFDLTDSIWSSLAESRAAEDHPQFRFAAVLKGLGISHHDVAQWGTAPEEMRNQLISLSLRPANVTSQWLSDGPRLGDLSVITNCLSLIEAPQPRDEALAIAVALREAVERGETAALIAPDATLARRVSAALGRWNIKPDDSGGVPLSLTAPGRFMRHVAKLVGKKVNPVDLMSLLKHPLTRAGEDRGPFQLITQEFELFLRRNAVAEVTTETLARFAETRGDKARLWNDWLTPLLARAVMVPNQTLSDALAHHLALAEGFNGPDTTLFERQAGEGVREVVEGFQLETGFSGRVTFSEYVRLFEKALSAESDRDQDGVRNDVMIWGTLEARVQGADLVILGGLNEGIWPEQPAPDPWLNRSMRREMGLLLPERQIGLAAHDFQQAVAAPRVILSRASRSEDSETVPSRWLNRLMNLLAGLPATKGDFALEKMRDRGRRYVALAASLDRPARPTSPAARPAPSPPASVRPKEFAVTEIQRLIRDPYAIYARHVLKLRSLDPLTPEPDARMKGDVLHKVLERFYAPETDFQDSEAAAQALHDIAWDVFRSKVPWPATRVEWWGHLSSISEWLILSERVRRSESELLKREVKGFYPIPGTSFALKGKADRIDRLASGNLVIYDYKTGQVPSKKTIAHFDRQLVLEAAMVEAGAFDGVPAETVSEVVHMDVGRSPEIQVTELDGLNETVTVSAHIAELLTKFDSEDTGYISRRAMEKERFEGDYDHLARFGEWDATKWQDAEPVR